MLWGVTFLTLIGVSLLVTVPESRRLLTRASVTRVAIVAVPAALVNAWFLLPTLAYGGRTAIATISTSAQEDALLRATSGLVSAANLFTFSRGTDVANTPDFALSLPILAIAWVLGGAIYLGLRRHSALMLRVAWVLLAWGLISGS